ncbi:DNA cytosine methyltransferase [Duganella vulcania]|uniref:DNA (cytosine-5-)-methyltransferase n=1 Tax=Duganella vulcania TaxID=2692166 RepID=A0A845GFR7_9BURK|nr:DNA cytosine methyltransferase [Duganella vulcania]MYM92350.1 hypothetical protein [Duganella vulcania]
MLNTAPHVKPSVIISAHVPDLITKELALVRHGDQRKIRLSTNFLPLMGFEPGRRHSVEVLPGAEGLRLAFDPAGRQKVYQRRYNQRKNNPFEAQIEVSSSQLLDAAIPGCTERIHCTMRHGEILIRPLANRTFSIRRNLGKAADPFAAMVAMSSGIDAHTLGAAGFNVVAGLDYRPQEARDKRDLTESGALTFLANNAPRYMFNEDVTKVDWSRLVREMADVPQLAVLHMSLCCDDFSTMKGGNLRRLAIEDATSTRDLTYDFLRGIEVLMPAVAVLEQVVPYGQSPECVMLALRLRRWGYHVAQAVLPAKLMGGLTGRNRFYLVASVYPGFQMPEPASPRIAPLWQEIEPYLAGCRDVSHTRSLQEGIRVGRARVIRPDSLYSPTLVKSQARQSKDSVYIEMPDGRYLLPSEELLRFLSGIPASFSFASVAAEQCAEQIGQGIDVPMHAALCRAVHEHIGANVGRHSAVVVSPAPGRNPAAAPVRHRHGQLALF